MLEGEGSENEEASERKGFWARVDLRLGAIDTTNINRKRRRERKIIRKVPSSNNNITYNEKKVRVHGKCMNM